mmetsp:Transcript_36803/g.102135  ORF Transcript_36803/g.102135 Transcript_36803/m.102135 type:complete len:166 (-) Transcript_36803:95-592(-)
MPAADAASPPSVDVGCAPCVRTLELAVRPALNDAEMLELNEGLLAAIARGDLATYKALCDPQLSCFEPEARGHLVTGLGFHEYYFHLYAATQHEGEPSPPPNTTVVAPHVRWLCDRRAAVVCFKRLVQRGTSTLVTEETRLWEFITNCQASGWRLVHFHRAAAGS